MQELIIYCQPPAEVPEGHKPADGSGMRFWRDFTPEEEAARLEKAQAAKQKQAEEGAKKLAQEQARTRVLADQALRDLAIAMGWLVP